MRAILRLLLVSGVLGVTGAVAASGQGHVVGFRGGVNFATMGGADLNTFETACACNVTTRSALTVGGFVTFNLGRVVKLQPELQYIGKGTKFDVGGTPVSIRVTYVELPVLLVVAPSIQGPLHPSFFGGPALALKAGCSLEGGGVSASCGSVQFPVKSVDYGLVFGAGLGYAMGRGELLLDGRYGLGFSEFLDTNPSPALKHRGVAVTAGYSFRLGR